MALQVQQATIPHVAHLLELDPMQAAPARLEVVDPVHVASRVNVRRLVPIRAVVLDLGSHVAPPPPIRGAA
jgi:hypothetical protein